MVELPGRFCRSLSSQYEWWTAPACCNCESTGTGNPEIVVLDEATSALDVSVQKTVIELITKLQREKNITFGFICHDIALVQLVAHQVAVMYLGNLVEVLPGKDLDMKAMHPYTKALMGQYLILIWIFPNQSRVLKARLRAHWIFHRDVRSREDVSIAWISAKRRIRIL